MSTLDTSGMLLEGIRLSTGNNAFTYPPRNFIGNDSFNIQSNRAEYLLIVDSLNPNSHGLEIANPNLVFLWVRNEPGITRFDWDGFGRRWMPSVGSSPDNLGVISNSPRLTTVVPTLVSGSPFSFYIGSPSRLITFNVNIIESATQFSSSLPSGQIEIASDTNEINFSPTDLDAYEGQSILSQRQSFFDRNNTNGSIGQFPLSSLLPHFLFLNPLPASGQVPRVRIGYGKYLTPVEVPNESSLGNPSPGTFTWSLDTGRVQFSDSDVDDNQEAFIYYDGITQGRVALTRTDVGPISSIFPIPSFSISGFIGSTDPQKYIIFAEKDGHHRFYFDVTIIDSSLLPSSPPSDGSVYLDTLTGQVYFSLNDFISFVGWDISYIHSILNMERGVAIQFFRSGINGSGFEQTPDFTIRYEVDDQILQESVGASPFIILPTTPTVDNGLHFTVDSGQSSSGHFKGELKNGLDETKSGLSYLLDLDSHQFKFAFRKQISITLSKPSSIVKLPDAAINRTGFGAKLNGSSIIPGVDFDFDPSTGLLEFIDSIGENDPKNVIGITGSVINSNTFKSNSPVFNSSHSGKFIFIGVGTNQGLYRITLVSSSLTIKVDPPFIDLGPDSIDIKQEEEIIADKFWTDFKPPMKKFSMFKASSPLGHYVKMSESAFSILASTGQVNLSTPAKPGESFQIHYIFLNSPDNGVTVTPIAKTEKALFKIRQEKVSVTVGSKIATFNSQNHVVNTARPIVLYKNGVTQDPNSYRFSEPGTLDLVDPIKSGDALVLDYWVEDAAGGETVFNLLSSPIEIDPPIINKGDKVLSFNGNQTLLVSPGSAFLTNDKDVFIVETVHYNGGQDVTVVELEQPALASSDGSPILVSEPINGTFRINENAPADVMSAGSNALYIGGVQSYRAGTVVTINGDPYLVLSSIFDSSFAQTKVSLASSVTKNYIIPIITKTIRPVYKSGSKFNTEKPAHLGYPFTLVKMGSSRKVLIRGTDYEVVEGGLITLNFDLGYGDILHTLYVSRKDQPTGSKFDLNYVHAINPTRNNGLLTQRLHGRYSLYAPDTFFYRIESVETFLPEVVSLLKQSAQSGTVSGPNTGNQSVLKNSDFGSPSLYFPEQNASNTDLVIRRLLKYYNDLINFYEDVLANLDGRVVGGTDGRFRFDGKVNNPPREDSGSITNDIDDRIKVYDLIELTGFYSFEEVPVYAVMGSPNALSRLFPIVKIATSALNNKVTFLDFGKTIGSLKTENLIFAWFLVTASSNSLFTTITPDGKTLQIPQNGDSKKLVPPFQTGQSVQLYSLDGVPEATGTITAIDAGPPITVTIDQPTSLTSGSLLQITSNSNDSTVHYYINAKDVIIDLNNGQILNFTLPPPLNSTIQSPPTGNEIVESLILFLNKEVRPRRIPSLDGLEQIDDGRVSRPQLKYESELALLNLEKNALSNFGLAKVTIDLLTISSIPFSISIGDRLRFVSGPNAGLERSVNLVPSAGTAIISSPLIALDLTGHDIIKVDSTGLGIPDLLQKEIGTIISNTKNPPGGSSLIGQLDSELTTIDHLIKSLGSSIISGTGSASGTTLTDTTVDFIESGIVAGNLLYVDSGSNLGLYLVEDVSTNSITVSSSSPYFAFPSPIDSPYLLINRYRFLSDKGPSLITEFLQKTLSFLNSTQAWASSLDSTNKNARISTIISRLQDIDGFTQRFSSLLKKDDKLYEIRYLWIDQRVNQKNGTLVKVSQAESKRAEDQAKLLEDQQKLLVAQSIDV